MRREDGARELVILVLIIIAGIVLWIAKAAGVDWKTALEVFARGSIVLAALGAGWYMRRDDPIGDFILLFLCASAGGFWFVSWPILDYWGNAAANPSDPMPWENTAWYTSWIAQWGILAVFGGLTVWLWKREE